MIIHIIGAQETNYPWAFELRVISGLQEMGHKIISTDFRKNRKQGSFSRKDMRGM